MDFNQDQLKKYVLGELTEDEYEDFEVRCLEDDSLYEKLLVVEDNLIDDLLREQMPTAERRAFERMAFRSPYLREKIAFAGAMMALAPSLTSSDIPAFPTSEQLPDASAGTLSLGNQAGYQLVKREYDLSNEIPEFNRLESRIDKLLYGVTVKLKQRIARASKAVTLFDGWEARANHWRQIQQAAFGLFCVFAVLYVFFAFSLGKPQQYVISSGGDHGSYALIAGTLAKTLNDSLSGGQTSLSHLQNIFFKAMSFEVRSSEGGQANINRISSGEAQLAIAQKGLSPQDPTKPHPKALLYLSKSRLFVIARKENDLKSLSNLRDLRNGTLYLGKTGSATRVVADLIVGHYKLPGGLASAQELDFHAAWEQLKTGKLEAGFFIVGPEGADEPQTIISQFAEDGNFRLLDVERAKGIQGAYPYLELTTIHQSTFGAKDDFPDRDVTSLQVQDVLVCSDKLSDSDAWTIIKTIKENLTKLTDKIPNLTAESPVEDKFAEKYYPSHPGALLYSAGSGAGNPRLEQLLIPFAVLLFLLFVAYRARRLKYVNTLLESVRGKAHHNDHALNGNPTLAEDVFYPVLVEAKRLRMKLKIFGKDYQVVVAYVMSLDQRTRS